MSIHQLLESIKKQNISSNYLLFGDEHFFIDEIDTCFLKYTIPDEEQMFNQKIFYGKDTDVFSLMNILKSYPIIGSKQLILLREAQELENIQELEKYFLKPVKSSIFIICFKNNFKKKIDRRKKWVKLIDKCGSLYEFKKMYENQIGLWISNYLNSFNLEIEKKAEALLVDSLGNNLSKISNAIKKLTEIINSSKITLSDVQNHIGIHREYNNFELQSALAKKNNKKVIAIVEYFLSNTTNFRPQPLIGLVFSFFSKLLIMHSLYGKPDKFISGSLKIHPFFLKEYKIALNNYSFDKCVLVIAELKSADLKFKGIVGSAKPDFIKDLLLKIIS
tara:strand:- start:4019 stop:5017 length:999 start_codon:yes stop_codon:yes gene_type:complete